MRVAVYYSNRDIRIEQRPAPRLHRGELLVKVWASGICGTDVMEWYRRDKVPLVLGHEIAGEIVATAVAGYTKGQRVVCSHHVPCGECHYCRMGHATVCETLRKTHFDPGGFCEYVRIPAINVAKQGVYVLPDSVSYEEGTCTEPLACVLRGQRLAGVKPGQTVLVIGSGISGLLHIQMAKVSGASRVVATDLVDRRLKLAEKLGVDYLFKAENYSPSELKKINDNRLADVVIVCAGAPQAMEHAVQSVGRGGTILLFAAATEGFKISLDINEIFWRNETTITSSYAANPEEHREALHLIASGKVTVKEMITHRFGLPDIQKGFQFVAEARESVKVIIEPQRWV